MDLIKRYIPIVSLVLLLLALAACGGDGDNAGNGGSSAPTGQELITKMEEAVKAVGKGHFTTEFQMATSEGGVRGTIESWAERPSNARAEFTSETAELNGMIIGSNETQSWVYSADQDTLYIFNGVPGTPNLASQPELDLAFWYATSLWEQGLNNIEATTAGSEEVNGRETYKVEVTYKEPPNPNISGDDLVTTYWIDKESFLPQKAEITLKIGEITGKGVVTLQDQIAQDETLDASLFSYQPGGNTHVVNFAEGEQISIEDLGEDLETDEVPEAQGEPGKSEGLSE